MGRTLLLLLALAGCATPMTEGMQADGSMVVRVTAERLANCRANGGCGLYSQGELRTMLEKALEVLQEHTCPTPNKLLL